MANDNTKVKRRCFLNYAKIAYAKNWMLGGYLHRIAKSGRRVMLFDVEVDRMQDLLRAIDVAVDNKTTNAITDFLMSHDSMGAKEMRMLGDALKRINKAGKPATPVHEISDHLFRLIEAAEQVRLDAHPYSSFAISKASTNHGVSEGELAAFVDKTNKKHGHVRREILRANNFRAAP